MAYQSTAVTGSYVPTTQIWDIGTFRSTDVNSPEFKELLLRLYQQVNNIAVVLNTKDSAFYVKQQFLTGQVWFNQTPTISEQNRVAYRIVINVGAIGAGVTNTAHNLGPTNSWKFTYIGGVASNTVTYNYYPLPSPNISMFVNGANVVINNTSGVTFDTVYVVLEFLKT